jgi:hypothetical protein
LFVFLAASLAWSAGDGTPVAVAQKLFDAMKAHDAAAASALFLPGATLGSIDSGGKATVIPFEKFVEHIGTSKSSWVERIWDPKVLEHGPIAVVWANYDFRLDGKLSHCGIDSFQMLKTESGWKIAAVSDTREMLGCGAGN